MVSQEYLHVCHSITILIFYVVFGCYFFVVVFLLLKTVRGYVDKGDILGGLEACVIDCDPYLNF